MEEIFQTSFHSYKLDKFVYVSMTPITKEEWEEIPDIPGELNAVAWPSLNAWFKVVEYFTEDDIIYLTHYEWEKAQRPVLIFKGLEDEKDLGEQEIVRVRKKDLPEGFMEWLKAHREGKQ